ncbi:MAG: hypothetical protein IPJ88_02710 [Myxococcales bacterium]|nr:MAG: hypothetical protein IPJ88_02710 [Myxococcales bacterium]
MKGSSEHLREALLDVELARQREQALRLESESVAMCLSTLTLASKPEQMFAELLRVLKLVLDFDEACIVRAEGLGVETLVSTSSIFSKELRHHRDMLVRLKPAQPLAIFDVSKLLEWNNQSPEMLPKVKSALYVPLQGSPPTSMLLATSAQQGHFRQSHVRRAKRLSFLVSQALERASDQKKMMELQQQLIDTARTAGKAEMAIRVLHHLGNAMNSISVSLDQLRENIQTLPLPRIDDIADLATKEPKELVDYLQNDQRGKLVLPYLNALSGAVHRRLDVAHATLSDLDEQVQNIARYVDDQNTRIESVEHFSKCDSHELIEKAIAKAKQDKLKNDIAIEITTPEAISFYCAGFVLCDILSELIANASSALQRITTRARTVMVSVVHAVPDSICFIVEDSGPGFTKQQLDALFTPDYRQGGFGLHDAAIAARRLGGSLSAQSDGPNQGAIFTLTVPLHHAESTVEK